MKKIITIVILAAAPIMFAQEKTAKSIKEGVKTEQQAKQKVKKAEVSSKAKVEKAEKKAIKQTEVKATENKGVKKQSLATQEKRK